MPQSFPDDSFDCIEQLFSPEILPNFPGYGKFWEALIGVDFNQDDRHLRPRRWNFPAGTGALEEKRISDEQERIAMTNYGIFCNLAGAHFQRSQALVSLSESEVSWRYFRFWEAFDVFYQHLGNARNGAHALWKWTRNLIAGGEKHLLIYLEKRGHSQLVKRWQRFVSDAQTIRDNVVHFARGAHVPMNGSFYVPIPISTNATWSEILARKGNLQEATKKMETDLLELESLLNETIAEIREVLTSFLSAKGITT